MKKSTISIDALASVSNISEMKEVAWEEVKKSFESFCLMAGVDSLMKMFEEDAEEICGPRYARGAGKRGHRWGTTQGKVGFHGGTIDVDRPRVRDRKGKEIPLPSWEAARHAGFLKQWAMNLTLMNVAMRKFGRAVRLPDATVPSANGSGLSKSAVSRRFVALTQQKLTNWMSSDLSKLDLVVSLARLARTQVLRSGWRNSARCRGRSRWASRRIRRRRRAISLENSGLLPVATCRA